MEQNKDLQNNVVDTSASVETETIQDDKTSIANKEERKSANWRIADKFFDVLLWVAIFLLAGLVLARAFVTTNIEVSGVSMSDTFKDGEVVWVNKMAKPQRGQVVVFFKNPIDSKFMSLFGTAQDNGRGGKYEKLIKRVVATEGDLIWVEHIENDEYRLMIKTPNGDVITEDYYVRGGESLGEFIIKDRNVRSGLGSLRNNIGQENAMRIRAGYFFVMGDNRGDSSDSRVIGEIPYDRLFGTLIDG